MHLINENYFVRHQLLKILYHHSLRYEVYKFHQHPLHFREFQKKLPKYKKGFLLDNLQYLNDTSEINHSKQYDDSTFGILSSGCNAFVEKKYLKQGWREWLDYLYDFGKTISVYLLLIIASLTFLLNTCQTAILKKSLDQMDKRINSLEFYSAQKKIKPHFNKLLRLFCRNRS